MLKSVLAEFPPEDEMDLRLQDAQQYVSLPFYILIVVVYKTKPKLHACW